MTAISAFKYSV